jgi:integrase
MSNKFTEPKLSTAGERWFVWFRFNGRQFKFTGDANRAGLTPKQRRDILKAEAATWKHRLENQHYNPITKLYEVPGAQAFSGSTEGLTFNNALDFAREKKSAQWTRKTGQDYASAVKYLHQAAIGTGIADLPVVDLKRSHIKTLLAAVQENRSLSAKGYNKYRDYLSSLVGELIQWDILESNPVEYINTQAAIQTRAHVPPTPEERAVIMKELREKHPEFYRFCSVLYGTTIREKEILALQVRDLDLDAQLIRIIPDRARENSKVKHEREVVIPNTLIGKLRELHLEAYPQNAYIFSKDFLPGMTRTHSNTPTLRWRKIVKEGLGIQRDLYSLKNSPATTWSTCSIR